MPQKLCRLCLNSERLIYMFDSRLNSQQQLRTCILLCTGVDILENDLVSKFVCHNCCTIAVKVFKYRKNAIANDRALKELVGQKYEEPQSSTEDLVKFQSSVLGTITKNKTFVADLKLNDDTSPHTSNLSIAKIVECATPVTNNSNNNNGNRKSSFAVHPSVRQLFKLYPKIIVPNELLQSKIEPKVALDEEDVHKWLDEKKHEKAESEEEKKETEIAEIDRFKQRYPFINIVKIQGAKRERDDKNAEGPTQEGDATELNSPDLAREQKSPTARDDRKRRCVQPESSELIPAKKKRVCAKPDRSFHKVELPQKSAGDAESTKSIFTSSLELMSSEKSAGKDEEAMDDCLEYSFLEPMSKEEVVICSCCGKMCDSRTQLKNHQRVHRRCIVCNTMHRSQEKLMVHLREVCYKTVEANQPDLELVRVDEVPDIVVRYQESFDHCFSAMDNADEVDGIRDGCSSRNSADEQGHGRLDLEEEDDDDVVIVDEFSNLSNVELVDEFPNEREYLSGVFKKHRDKLERTKTNTTQTMTPSNATFGNHNNMIVIENMCSELSMYRIPLELQISPSVSASIAYRSKVGLYRLKCGWTRTQAVALTKPTRNSSTTKEVVNSMPPPPVPRKKKAATSGNGANKNSAVPAVVRYTTNNSACPNVTIKVPIARLPPKTSGAPIVLNKAYAPGNPIKTTDKHFVGAKASNVAAPNPKVPRINKLLVLQNNTVLNSFASGTVAPQYVAPISGAVQTNAYGNGAVGNLATSAAAVPTSSVLGTADGGSFLRVKAPWELNQTRYNAY